MKKILSLIPLVLFSFIPLWAIAIDSVPIITVTGNAKIEVVPDQMIWHVRISVEGKDPLDLKSKNDHSSNAVLKALEARNVRKEKIQSSGLSFHKVWRKDSSKYYSCNNHIRFVLEDLDAYPELMDALIKTPYVFVSSTGFTYSKQEEVIREARRKALVDAQKKATEMLDVYGMQLGNPIRINEQSSPQHFPRVQHYAADFSMARKAESHSPLSEGTLTLSNTVSVQFEIKFPEEKNCDPRE